MGCLLLKQLLIRRYSVYESFTLYRDEQILCKCKLITSAFLQFTAGAPKRISNVTDMREKPSSVWVKNVDDSWDPSSLLQSLKNKRNSSRLRNKNDSPLRVMKDLRFLFLYYLFCTMNGISLGMLTSLVKRWEQLFLCCFSWFTAGLEIFLKHNKSFASEESIFFILLSQCHFE